MNNQILSFASRFVPYSQNGFPQSSFRNDSSSLKRVKCCNKTVLTRRSFFYPLPCLVSTSKMMEERRLREQEAGMVDPRSQKAQRDKLKRKKKRQRYVQKLNRLLASPYSNTILLLRLPTRGFKTKHMTTLRSQICSNPHTHILHGCSVHFFPPPPPQNDRSFHLPLPGFPSWQGRRWRRILIMRA